MSRKANIFWIIYSIVFGCAGLVSVAYTIFIVGTDKIFAGVVSPLFSAIALVLGMIYLLRGYKKEDAKLFKVFLAAYAIELLFRSIACCAMYPSRPAVSMFACFTCTVTFGIVAVLFFAKDLGQKTALNLSGVSFIISCLFSLCVFAFCKGIMRGGDIGTTLVTISSAKQAIISTILLVCVRSKYIDKKGRGTK